MRLVGGDDEVGRVGCHESRWSRLRPVLPDERVRQAQSRVEAPRPARDALRVRALPSTYPKSIKADWIAVNLYSVLVESRKQTSCVRTKEYGAYPPVTQVQTDPDPWREVVEP